MKRVGIIAAIILVAAGCAASTQQFAPTERVQGRTLEGNQVAIYPIAISTGQVGEAKVWSRGAYKTEGGQTVVRIGVEVQNTGSVPIELQPQELTLDAFAGDRGTINGIRPIDQGPRTFAPGQTQEADLIFPLPPGVKPGHVGGLRLNWQVHVADQIYAQRTPFTEQPEPNYAYDYYGPYGNPYPYPYGYWGFGYYGPVYRYYGPVYRHGHYHGYYGHYYRGHGHHHH